MELKIIITTSDRNRHIVPIFAYFFNKNWDSNQKVEVVGYKKPDIELPSNFTFVSLGEQSEDKKDFSNNLKKYFEKQDDWFIWMVEDCFIKSFKKEKLDILLKHRREDIGRINLSSECIKQEHTFYTWADVKGEINIYQNTQTAKYRVSTQPSIWNKKFLLQYLKKDLSPWDFETQNSINDGWKIIGLDKENAPIEHNEGVRKWDLYEYDFNGFPQEQIEELRTLKII